ncbi:MAG: translocation/assembly module TamB [Treponema sp.]|nr:translocation/assembly module TamB [Treponema sp.]
MSNSSQKGGEKALSRSFYVKVLIFCGIICLSAIAMQPIQAALSQIIRQLRTDFIEKIEEMTGLRITYSSIRPSFFGSIDIRNLNFMKEDEPVFTINRIRIRFSLYELIVRKNFYVHTIQIERPDLNIDTLRDKDTFELLSKLFDTQEESEKSIIQSIADFLPRQINYHIRHGNFRLSDGDAVYVIEDLNLSILEEDREILLNGKFDFLYLNKDFFDRIVSVKTEINLSGITSQDLKDGKANISFSTVTFSQQERGNQRVLFSVNPFRIAFSYNESGINVSRSLENSFINYSFNYMFNTGILNARLDILDFKIGDIINLSSYLRDYSHFLHLQLTGNSYLSYNTNLNKVAYSVDLRGGITSEIAIDLLPDTFILNAYGNEQAVYVNNLTLSSSINPASETDNVGFFHGMLTFTGNIEFSPLMPSGIITLDDFSFTGNESINAVFNLSSKPGEIRFFSDRVNIADTGLNNFNTFIFLSETDIGITSSCFNDNNGDIFFDAVYNRNKSQLEASVSVTLLSVYEITRFFRPFFNYMNIPVFAQNVLKDSFINTDIFFSTDFNNILYNAPNITFVTGGAGGKLSLSGTDRQVTINEGIIFVDENDLIFSANLNFFNPMDLNFFINASYQDLAWHVTGQLLDRRTLIIHDPNGFHVFGNITNTGAISGYMEAIDFPVLINSQTVYLNFFSALRFNSIDFWTLDINHFLAIYGGGNSIKFSGITDQDGASFRDILYIDSFGILAGSINLSWDVNFSYIELLVNLTDGDEEGENYFIEGIYKDRQVNAKATVSNMYVNRLTNGNQPIIASGEMSFHWDSINLFNANFNITSFYTMIQNDPLYASVNVYISDDELFIRNLNINLPEISALLPELYINISQGVARTTAVIDGFALDKNIEGVLDFNADFEKINSWLDIEKVFNEFNGTVSIENAKYGNLSHNKMTFLFSSANGNVSVTGGIRDFLRLDMESDGSFMLGLASPFPLHGTITGTYKEGIIDASCHNLYMDMFSFWNLMPDIEEFRIAGGYISGHMDFRGPIWNPGFYGVVRASSMRFVVPNYITEDIRPVPFLITAEGNEMTFGPIVTAVGSGGGITNGWFQFEHWIPKNIYLDISIPRESPVPYGFNISGFLAEGNASGNLKINIDIDQFVELTGDLHTNYAELGLNIDEITHHAENTHYMGSFNTFVNMRITTGSMVEFTWPIISPIIRANPEMGTVILISADSQAGQYSLNSDVRIRSGEIYYLVRSFFIRQGNIVFRENENQFDPRITARAEIRDRAEAGNVTISMIVENQPLLRFEPRFESNPSLTMLEIYSILGQNFSNIQGEDNTDMARFLISSSTEVLTQIIASSDTLSQFVFFRQIERQMRDFLGLDMFSVRTRFFQNVFMEGFSGFGQNPVDSNQGVGNYFDNTTVFIGKYIGRDMFIQGMLTMRYDENNTSFGGMVFEPDIGIELQSPFVNIRWDFFPYHPENWWVSGSSITLRWSMSF